MRRLRSRTAIVLVLAGIAAFAGLLPLGAAGVVAVLTPLWTIVPSVQLVLLRRTASQSDEQPIPLLSVLLSRAPPAHAVA